MNNNIKNLINLIDDIRYDLFNTVDKLRVVNFCLNPIIDEDGKKNIPDVYSGLYYILKDIEKEIEKSVLDLDSKELLEIRSKIK